MMPIPMNPTAAPRAAVDAPRRRMPPKTARKSDEKCGAGGRHFAPPRDAPDGARRARDLARGDLDASRARDASRRSSAARRARRGVGTRTAAARSSDAARERELEYLERARDAERCLHRARARRRRRSRRRACGRCACSGRTATRASPSGFARCTHGFGEIPAGMQPAACDLIMRECFEATATRAACWTRSRAGGRRWCARRRSGGARSARTCRRWRAS